MDSVSSCSYPITGTALANHVMETYGTTDVHTIAKQAGVEVVYEQWHPVTFGEYDRCNTVIRINLNAPVRYEIILAHELAHFFIHQNSWILTKAEEEDIARVFAAVLSSEQ